MKVTALFEASDEMEDETDEEIIELGRLVQYMLKAGEKPSQQTFKKAAEYLQSNPELDASSAAVALDALAGGRLGDYYHSLKRQNPDLSRFF